MDIINAKLKPLSKFGDSIPQIKQVATNLNVESGVIVGAAGLVFSLITLILFGTSILTLCITVLYPAAMSIKAIETESTEDDKEWLTYWIIFGIFTLLDDFLGFILNMIPYFFWIKLVFFVYLFAPQTHGAKVVYENVVKPQLIRYKPQIEDLINTIKGGASELAKEAKNEALKQAQDPKNFMKAAQLASQAEKELDKLNTTASTDANTIQ